MTAEQAFRAVFSPPIVQHSLVVALVVGTILNLINQGDVLLSRQAIVLWKVALTYCVPFVVASYGSYTALRLQRQD